MCITHVLAPVCHMCIDKWFKMLITKMTWLNEDLLTAVPCTKLNYLTYVASIRRGTVSQQMT